MVCRVVLCCDVLCCAVLYNTVLCCVVMRRGVLWCVVPRRVLLWCVVLACSAWQLLAVGGCVRVWCWRVIRDHC